MLVLRDGKINALLELWRRGAERAKQGANSRELMGRQY
jgi:hypothetical protein